MRQRLSKGVLCLLLLVLLTGCFQVQISGTVVGATITITRIDGVGGTIVIGPSEGKQAWVAALGEEFWQDLSALWRIFLSGIVHIPADIKIDPQVYYLATASGGVDNDPLRSRDLASPPAAVSGDWHAIVKGERLLNGNLQISIVTEAIYQVLKPELPGLTTKEIGQRLNQLTKSILTNIDTEPAVNYDDALIWSYLLDEAKYKGDSRRLGELADLYAPGNFSEAQIELLARAVIENEDPAGTQPATVCASVVHQPPPGMPQFPSRIEIDTDLGPTATGAFTMTIPGANDSKPLTINVAKDTGVFGIRSYGTYKIDTVVFGSSNISSGFAALPTINVTEEESTLWCRDIRVRI